MRNFNWMGFVGVLGLGVAAACSSSDSDVPPGGSTGGSAGAKAGNAGTAGVAGSAGAAGTTGGSAGSDQDSGPQDAPAEAEGDGGLACDVVAQNCPGSQKCVMVNAAMGDGGSLRTNACVDPDGTGDKVLDDLCTRSELGHDDCTKGLVCTFLPNLKDEPMHCRKFCVLDTDCPATGEACYNFGNGAQGLGGICLPTCTVFGTDCLDGQSCRIYWNPMGTQRHGICFEASNTKTLGEACAVPDACKDFTAHCDDQPVPSVYNGTPNGTCRLMCDTAHPCDADAGTTCTPLTGFPDGLGVCK